MTRSIIKFARVVLIKYAPVLLAVFCALWLPQPPVQAHTSPEFDAKQCNSQTLSCPLQQANELFGSLSDFPDPVLQAPRPKIAIAGGGNVTYVVETRGAITVDMQEFKAQANQTLNDGRGWARMGVSFSEVASGGSFTLVLATPTEVAAFSPGCGADYSCNVGRYVIINQDRWLGATQAWNSGGGNLRDYRHMVVNHETGHWLGHGHSSCPAAGQPAPVMQQQSIDLQGCTFNPWPLETELTSSRLGI